MKGEPTWHRVSFEAVTRRTDAEQPEARRWRWRNAGGQLRLRSPRGRERVFQLGKKRPGAWVRRMTEQEMTKGTERE